MARSASIAVIGACAMLAGASHLAYAQNTDAEALFTEGERLEAAGKLAEACDSFEASNRIEARAGTLIRLGQCREDQGRLASAWSAYKDALTRVKDPAKRRIAEQRAAALESRLSTLTVLVPDTSRIDGLIIERNGRALDAALWNRAAPVDGGVYTIGGHAPGHEEWTTTVEVGTENDRASIEVPRFKELRQLVDAPTPAADADDSDSARADLDAPARRLTRRRKAALAVAVGAVAAAGAGAVLAVNGRALEGDAARLCPDPALPCEGAAEAQALGDRARTRVLAADVAFGVAGTAAIGAAVLWLTGAPSRPSRNVTVSPLVRPGVTGAAVIVRF